VIAIGAIAVRAHASPPAVEKLQVRRAVIEIEFAQGDLDLPRKTLMDHISKAACAVSTYYGGFPADRYRLMILPIVRRRGVLNGTTWGSGGPHSRILVGEHTTAGDLDDDWIVTHEMIHVAFPSMADKHHWIEEGVATYVEPLARSWVGSYSPQRVWSDLIVGLPKGMPVGGDEGLDTTHTWGRTYWGGAMFCSLADVEIRRHTRNQRGLIDALRGIFAASGGIKAEWPLERALKAGDDAVGTLLEQLYAKMGLTSTSPDLQDLWKRLGVRMKEDQAELDDSASDAAIRRAISRRPPDAPPNCVVP
jgi:hypothetical protein